MTCDSQLLVVLKRPVILNTRYSSIRQSGGSQVNSSQRIRYLSSFRHQYEV